MKPVIRIGLCLLIAGCLLSFAGCKKKADETKPDAPVATNETKPAVGD
ncbi:MAG: hypothetical protein IMZ61_06485 [Planctomycetes bacterium]|nr:hypothetical protein [Planctomycetota bacterium]